MLSAKTFWSRTREGPNGCIEWAGCTDRSGYGRVGRNQVPAHRLAYRLAKGEPGELLVCHSCDNPRCVNPAHLWLGTHTDNMRDMAAKGRHAKGSQTRCSHGHPFDAENTRFRLDGSRACKACNRAAVKRYAGRRGGKTT